METVYVAFERPQVAAVRLTSGPPLFSAFAASIRQTPLASRPSHTSTKWNSGTVFHSLLAASTAKCRLSAVIRAPVMVRLSAVMQKQR